MTRDERGFFIGYITSLLSSPLLVLALDNWVDPNWWGVAAWLAGVVVVAMGLNRLLSPRR